MTYSADSVMEWGIGAILMNNLINESTYEYYADDSGYYYTYWGDKKDYNHYYGVYADYVGTDNWSVSQWNAQTSASQGYYQNQSYADGWYSSGKIYSFNTNAPVASAVPVQTTSSNSTGTYTTYTLTGASKEYDNTYYTLSVIVPGSEITTSNTTQNISQEASSTAGYTLVNNGTTTTSQVITLSTTLTDTGSTTTAYGFSAGITASLTEAVTLGTKDVASETTSGTITGSLQASYSNTQSYTTTSTTAYSVSTTLTALPGQTAVATLWYSQANTYMDWEGPGTISSSTGNYLVTPYSAENYNFTWSNGVSYALQEAINYGIPTASYITPASGIMQTGGSVFMGTGYNVSSVVSNYTSTSDSTALTDISSNSDVYANSLSSNQTIDSVIEGLRKSQSKATRPITSSQNGITKTEERGWYVDNYAKYFTASMSDDYIINYNEGQIVYLKGGGSDIIKGSDGSDILGADLSMPNSSFKFISGNGNDIVYVSRAADKNSHFNLDLSGKGHKTIQINQSAQLIRDKSTANSNTFDQISFGSDSSTLRIENHAMLHLSGFKLGTDKIEWDKDYTVSLNGPTFLIKSKDGSDEIILRDAVSSLLTAENTPNQMALLNPEIFLAPYNARFKEPESILTALVSYGITNQLRKSWSDVTATQASLDSFVNSATLNTPFSEIITNKLKQLALSAGTFDEFWTSYGSVTGKSLSGFIQNPNVSSVPNSIAPRAALIDIDYIASYNDLITAFGANVELGVNHYYNFGISEGRKSDRFNEIGYLLANPDVANHSYYKHNPALHYVLHGYNEGRPQGII